MSVVGHSHAVTGKHSGPAVQRFLASAVALCLTAAIGLAGAAPASAGTASGAQAGQPATAAAERGPTDAPLTVAALRANDLTDPLGVDPDVVPLLDWQLRSGGRGIEQTAYQIQAAASPDQLGDDVLWDSGRIESTSQIDVAYEGPALTAGARVYWRVKVWDNLGTESAWSEPAWFEAALSGASDWQAEWIGRDSDAVSQRWDDYTMVADLEVEPGKAFGFYLRADSTRNAYMWQLNDSVEGKPAFRPHNKINDAWSVLAESDLTTKGLPADVLKHEVRMEVRFVGDTITTLINGVEVDSRTDSSHAAGPIGFRASGVEGDSALIRSISVVHADGEPLYTSDFAAGDNPFGVGKIVPNEGLRVDTAAENLWSPTLPIFRTDFASEAGKTVESARVYASGLGLYELSLNGEKVGDHQEAPGWTNYESRIQYQIYDVTDQIAAGDNAIGAMIAPGWYSGYVGWFGTEMYGTELGFIAQLEIDYTDGSTQTVVTDDSWTSTEGPFISADLLMGESYDAKREQAGWNQPGFDESVWTAAETISTDATAKLVPQTDEPVRIVEELPAIAQTVAPNGSYIYDLGQNMAGVGRFTLTGEVGQQVTIRHGEVLDKDGSLYTANLRSAKATDHYTFADDGTITYQPRFTQHGFRYIEISGLDAAPALSAVTGVVFGSDLPTTGEFTTSDSMLNQLQSNIVWGQRGNFISVPTDTPARDERLGYTGDLNAFVGTATYNMDSVAFFKKFLRDVSDSQTADGDIPEWTPHPEKVGCCNSGTSWNDAVVTVPWTSWERYGDTSIIRDNWDEMTAFFGYLETEYPGYLRADGPYGDWLNLGDDTPAQVMGTAYYAYDARLMSQMAEAIGLSDEAARYAAMAEDATAVFVDNFVKDDGTVGSGSQTSYALALGMDLLPEDLRSKAADKLVANIESREGHLSTGFVGTPWLMPALSSADRWDTAYGLLQQTTIPSWGYEVVSGATTMWERWDSIDADGNFGDVGMNSFNHYAFGAVGDWMYQNVAGIQPTGPGYKTFSVAPRPGGTLTSASGSFDSVYGSISSEWAIDGDATTLNVSVPVSTTATVRIPVENRWTITENGAPLSEAAGVKIVGEDGGAVTVEVGSGEYAFHAAPANAGLVVSVESSSPTVIAGDEFTGALTVTNTSAQPITGFRAELTASGGLAVAPDDVLIDSLPAGESRVIDFAITVPITTPASDFWLDAAVSATVSGEVRRFTVTESLGVVESAVSITALEAVPSSADSPISVEVSTTTVNIASSPVSGRIVLDVPAGWQTPVPSPKVTIKPQSSVDVPVVLAVPLTVDAKSYSVTAKFVPDGAADALTSSTGTFDVGLSTEPEGAMDHIDLGDQTDETAHALASSGDGGTSNEAGLSRRYSGQTPVGSWFEFTMDVTPGEPFLIRGIETFDRAQTKSYDILVNGTLITQRLSQRIENSAGTRTFQLLVPDDGTLTASGSVTIRMRFNGVQSYDPSVADVWTLPVPADTMAPSTALEVSNAGAAGWHVAGAEATLTGVDTQSGVASTEYRLDSGAWIEYSSPVSLPEGETMLSYRSTDVAGNVGDVQSATLRVDGILPTVWAWLTDGGRVAAVGQDGGSGIQAVEYSTNGTDWVAGLSALLAQDSALDARESSSLMVRAVDIAGNVSEKVKLEPTSAPSPLPVEAGQSALIEGDGFDADGNVRIELRAPTVVLGEVTADARGVVSLLTNMPADIASGDLLLVFVPEEIAVTPPSPGDGTGEPSQPGGELTVPAELAATGANSAPWIVMAALFLLAGAATAWGLGRRRKVGEVSEPLNV